MDAEEQYKKGFNSGYLLKKFQSDLLELLLKNLTGSGIVFQGLSEGKKYREMEMQGENFEYLRAIKESYRDVEKDR